MKRGFTLIELLGVLVILVVLTLIASPIILNFIKNGQDEITESKEKMITMAARNWATDHRGYSTPCYVKVSTLKDSGYLNKDFKIQVSSNGATASGYVLISKNGTYSYSAGKRGSIPFCNPSN